MIHQWIPKRWIGGGPTMKPFVEQQRQQQQQQQQLMTEKSVAVESSPRRRFHFAMISLIGWETLSIEAKTHTHTHTNTHHQMMHIRAWDNDRLVIIDRQLGLQLSARFAAIKRRPRPARISETEPVRFLEKKREEESYCLFLNDFL